MNAGSGGGRILDVGRRIILLVAFTGALAAPNAEAAPTAQCALSLPAGPLIGADLAGSVTLTPTAGDPLGFQPAVEVILPAQATFRSGSAQFAIGGSMVESTPMVVPPSGQIVNPYTGQTEDLVAAGLAQPGDA